MTAYAGSGAFHALFANDPHVSTDLRIGLGGDLSLRPLVAHTPMSTGAPTFNEPISIEHVGPGARAAGYAPGSGDYIFERIHVLPATRTVPFILSSQHVLVEVWNAFRTTPQTAATVTLAGPAGVSIVSGPLAAVVFPPMESIFYDVLIAAAGAPRANNTITWDFGIPAPIFRVTGLRLLPFTISPDWATGVDETLAWVTDVLAAYDTTEQRMLLRTLPIRQLAFVALANDSAEASLMMALLYAWQGRSYGVPLWQRGAPLAFSVGPGAQDLVVDTTFMNVVPGDSVILIMDAFNWFASTIESMTAGTMRLDSGVDRTFWSTRTLVVPVKLGRVAMSLPVARPSNSTASHSVTFDLEVVEVLNSAPVPT